MQSFKRVDPHYIAKLVKDAPSKSEGAKRVLDFIRYGLAEKKFTAEQVSIRDIGIALGVIDPFDMEGSLRECMADAISTERVREERIFTESNPVVMTNSFQVITGELIASEVIAGYEDDSGFIGDRLVRTMTGQRLRNQRITGMRALSGPKEVSEGHPYEETGFEEKYVTTSETKKGRLLSISAELILFDQTGEILNRARNLGYWTRQEREKTIVQGVTGDTTAYRPSGVAETLYATDGSNFNYIGVGNTTSSGFATAVPLVDWTDVDTVLTYRATEVKDDRVDGTTEPIMGLNSSRNVLLVPEAKRSTGTYIKMQTSGVRNSNLSSEVPLDQTMFNRNPVADFMGEVLSSPFMDSESPADWYYGDFEKQFVWTEIWPVQVFTQGRDSEAAFERDVEWRMKVRYYGGLSATDTVYVTKVDGV